MRTPTTFIFDTFQLDPTTRQILLNYSYDDGQHFTETIQLPSDLPLHNLDNPDVQRALFALHLAGGASYYKAFCPKNIEVRSGELSQAQADFWNTFYTKGMGEFFYINKLDFHGLINFPATANIEPLPSTKEHVPHRALVPFGGGKDSLVTLELLKNKDRERTLFRLGQHHFIDRLVKETGEQILIAGRKLDGQLFELNAQGAYNGHVPITGYISFLTIVICLLGDYDSVFFSNERSADYGNVEYLGMQVNHQWSKSIEAELLMRDYITQFVTTEVQYLNALRPLSELKITEIFARYPEYFDFVTSCNRNWRIINADPNQQAWCGECPKCAFVFTLLAAFLPSERVIKMFGKNMFDDPKLLGLYRELWGRENFKPFECVGTPEEAQAATYLALRDPGYANTVVGREFSEHVLPTIVNPDTLVKATLAPDFEHVPPFIVSLVKEEL